MHLVVLAFFGVRSYKHTMHLLCDEVSLPLHLLPCISHCSELDVVSNRDFLSAVSTAPRFVYFNCNMLGINKVVLLFCKAKWLNSKCLNSSVKSKHQSLNGLV